MSAKSAYLGIGRKPGARYKGRRLGQTRAENLSAQAVLDAQAPFWHNLKHETKEHAAIRCVKQSEKKHGKR